MILWRTFISCGWWK